jgi:sensor histidine kinase YesM
MGGGETMRDPTAPEDDSLRLQGSYRQPLLGESNPHFLFNTLNLIARMAAREGAGETEEMVLHFAKYLRYLLRKQNQNELIPLRQELEGLEHLFHIFKKRFGEKLEYQISPEEETLSLFVPFLILLPLVEEILVQRVEESTVPLTLEIRTGVTPEKYLEIVLQEKSSFFQRSSGEGEREILAVQERIRYHYGEAGELTIESLPGGETRRVILLPLR